MYKEYNGTSYKKETSFEVIKWLETSRERRQRIRIFYGKNGKCWNEEYNILGTIGRSNGTIKIPILIHNSKSFGGCAILDDCIIRIDTRDRYNNIITVYEEKNAKFDTFVSTDLGNVYNETKDELYARCKNGDSGKNLALFMNGKRWKK